MVFELIKVSIPRCGEGHGLAGWAVRIFSRSFSTVKHQLTMAPAAEAVHPSRDDWL
jgi:hypothetical protein